MNTIDIAALVQPNQVHRSLYTSPQIFTLEMQRLWARSWLFVGHDSQVPQAGDFITTTLAGQPLLMVKQPDGSVAVLHNRCAHKGAQLTLEPAGHAGRTLQCPYHGWRYALDGRLQGQPLQAGYAGSGFEHCPAAQGLTPYGEVAVHRGFVFARSAAGVGGPPFGEWAGELLEALDLLADRSPQGRLQVAGGVLRTVVPANWKVYLENINDAVHPVTAHQSVSDAATAVWTQQGQGAAPPLAMRQMLPFGSGYRFFQAMGGRVLPHGHSVLGTQHSIHNDYASLPDYAEQLSAAHGPQRAQAVLAFVPQNVVFYPSIAIKGAPQVMRVIRPLAVDRTLVEAWAFEAVGAPAPLLESALTYNCVAFSPASIVAHDDLHLFECVQQGLAAQGNEWVSLHREAGLPDDGREVSGTDEALLRNQYAAWAAGVAAGGDAVLCGPAIQTADPAPMLSTVRFEVAPLQESGLK